MIDRAVMGEHGGYKSSALKQTGCVKFINGAEKVDDIYLYYNTLSSVERKNFIVMALRFKKVREYLKKYHLLILMPVVYKLYRGHIVFKNSKVILQRMIYIYLGSIIIELESLIMQRHRMDIWDIIFVVLGAVPVMVSIESISRLIYNLEERVLNGW